MFKTMEIDRKAQIYFQDNLPPAWLVREQKPDFHIDYFVELFDTFSGPLGTLFGVQLKGTNSPKYSKKFIKISMETKHIEYYLDKVKQPIILIVVDVRKKKGYYLFLQEWVNKLPKKTWRNQQNLVVKIPINNLLSNTNELEMVIRNADVYMRDLWPSSIVAAVNYEKHRLENLDSRCEVSISYSNGNINYNILPKENVRCSFLFKNAEHIQKGFTDLYNRGLPISIDSNDILNIEGSDLIRHALDRSLSGKLIIDRKYESVLIISTCNELNQETSLLYEVKGFLSGGTKEVRFEGGIKESPFRIKCFIELDEVSFKSCNFTITFDYSSWERLPILQLPFFERIYSFFKAILEGNAIKIVCEMKGIFLFEGKPAYISEEKISKDDYEFLRTIYNYLTTINKARSISLQTVINLILPKVELISRDDIDNIDMIYELINKQKYRKDASNIRFNAEMIPNEECIEFIKNKVNKKLTGPMIFELQDVKYSIFGKEINLGPLKYTITNPKLLIDGDINELKCVENNSINIKIVGTDDSELIINKIST